MGFYTGTTGRNALRAAGGVAVVEFADGRRVQVEGNQASLVETALTAGDYMTTTVAAQFLGVSRPMVLRWIKDGSLEDRPVGTHHRLTSSSVLTLLEKREAAGQAAMDVLAAAEKGDATAAARVEAARERARAQIAVRDSAGA